MLPRMEDLWYITLIRYLGADERREPKETAKVAHEVKHAAGGKYIYPFAALLKEPNHNAHMVRQISRRCSLPAALALSGRHVGSIRHDIDRDSLAHTLASGVCGV